MEDYTDMLVSYGKFSSATYIADFLFQPSNLCGGTRRTPIHMYHPCCTVEQSHTLSFSFVRYKISKRSKHHLCFRDINSAGKFLTYLETSPSYSTDPSSFASASSNSSSQGCRRKRATFVKQKAELQTLKPRPNPGPISFVHESRNEVSISIFLDECFETNTFV